MELKTLITTLSSMMSISGNENYSGRLLFDTVGGYFDESYTDQTGNHVFVKKCGREGAPKLMICCHFDEIGMVVTGIKEGGFLTVTNIGGVDTRLLPSEEVVIYGKEKIYGIIGSTPPHLKSAADADKLKTIGELLIDTGYPKEELEQICPVGTPVGFYPRYTALTNGRISGKAFDDKACGACAIYGICSVSREQLAADVYFVFTHREEVGSQGALTATYNIDPDYALVMDVTHAWIPEMEGMKWSALGSGVAIAMSAVTNRKLTKMAISICEEKGIKYTREACPGNTGTDANRTGTVRAGVPTVLASLPLRNMHTPSELLSLDDAEALARFTAEFIKSKEIAEVYAR